jgi:alpha-glucuronidase
MKAEDGHEAWLRYRRVPRSRAGDIARAVFMSIKAAQAEGRPDAALAESALSELVRAGKALVGKLPRVADAREDASIELSIDTRGGKPAGSFRITVDSMGTRAKIEAGDCSGLLYGAFRLIFLAMRGALTKDMDLSETPTNKIRMLDHWDNGDGSVERGYSGASIFFERGRLKKRLDRVASYARLLASIGVNAIAPNNVNVHATETRFITDPYLPDLARLAGVLRPWGIRLFVSVNFASPLSLGELDTADPLDPRVAAWWKARADAIYRAVPDFGGFLVKADSEGRPGPFSYGRSHAEGANMLAKALKEHGGLVMWRCFVYNCRQDWRDRSIDRAKAAYEHFKPLDGAFEPNVLLQIKNGPMDFQPREPVSPLFGGMRKTNQLLELQVTQEYLGQQRHACFLPSQWSLYLNSDLRVDGRPGTTLARIASGEVMARPLGGITGVSNVGMDANWTGHDLAQANLYGFGRLAWDPSITPEAIASEWVAMTFRLGAKEEASLVKLLLSTWKAYEDYSAPLGVGWMVNQHHHYGPNPDGYEYDRWGTYHFADRDGVGVDRSVATGTGYAGQYHSELAATYESLERCPDELLLFFHHVPYGHVLKSGKTVIQHIYDSHFDGAEAAATFLEAWSRLEGSVDPGRFEAIKARFEHQKDHAREWRDIINTYFYRKSGVPDEKGRKIYR